jgi:hypothetical protein
MRIRIRFRPKPCLYVGVLVIVDAHAGVAGQRGQVRHQARLSHASVALQSGENDQKISHLYQFRVGKFAMSAKDFLRQIGQNVNFA